jgi:Ca2+-binding RTX toxin-like protein
MLWLALLLLLAFPAAAGAATASVQPYVEPPDTDPFGSCARYAQCPPDMVVFDGAVGEVNRVTITQEAVTGPWRARFRVRDEAAPVQAGQGCEQLETGTVACSAATIGPLRLGDGDDRLDSPSGEAWGGEGHDLLTMRFGPMQGEAGDDVLTGAQGDGGPGHDLLAVGSGEGGPGGDILRCPPASLCHLDGGPGDDRITGGRNQDRLFGRRGDDILRGGADFDILLGHGGDDRLVGGRDGDHLRGGRGTDRLLSREDTSAGEDVVLDRVNCGIGRRDVAVVDRRDDVKRCERVRRRSP